MTYDKTYQSTLLVPGNDAANPQSINPINGKSFKLAELYKLLDCNTIEVVHLGESGLILIIDEDGKFTKPAEHNASATAAWWKFVPWARNQNYIVGKAILCHTSKLR